MEPSKEAIAVRISRLNRQILGKVSAGSSKFSKKTIDREALLDALTVLYDECNDDPVKKCDDLVRAFVDKYRSPLAELRRIRVCISDFEILHTIGRGQFGDVHMVREKETHDVYALKCVRKEEARKRVVGAADERDVLAGAAGPWAPKLQYAFQDNTTLYLVMELCSGGDLAGLLSRRHNPLSERDAAFYVAEVAHALKALHQLGFVHRDLKPHNILIDRCGHVKLGDFGSCSRLADGDAWTAVGTPDYVAPELLAAADCARRHAVCAECCRGIEHTALSACDYWSLGVVAFELVTLRRPFSTGDDDSIATILSNIQKYERSPDSEPPFEAPPDGPSEAWRALVAGLLRVTPSKRFNYLDTLQHPSLAHLSVHSIRDQVQAPPWVPRVRGAEDASCFSPPPREAPPVSAAPFRARPPFAGQLPFVGYSYVAHDENEDNSSTSGFSASHDCTAIDLATFKSSEKLLASRGREIASLQSKLAAAETAAAAAAEKVRRAADAEHERTRARLQAEITALSLQNKRLERQIEIEKEERMALERTNQELTSAAADRNNAELRVAQAKNEDLASERDGLREDMARLEARVKEMQTECARAVSAADAARAQHKHYKDILEQAQDLRHRTLTELNVRAIDTIAKERALRRQTLSGGEAETREAGARAAAEAEASAREARARVHADKRRAEAEADARDLRRELEDVRREYATVQESLGEKQRVATASTEQLKEAQLQLTQERVRASTLAAQVQELQRSIQEAATREAALEEQCSRTEARFNERLDAAEARAAAALQDDARHREKVNTLEQLVRQLEREVTALENRACINCEARNTPHGSPHKSQSDTESVADTQQTATANSDTESVADTQQTATANVLREQLERAETQLQTRAEEIAALRQEARSANLARWRKEREFNELSLDAKSTARDLKRAEERLTAVLEAKRTAERKVSEVQTELNALKPQYEQATKEAERAKQQLAALQKKHETAQAEVDRSRNDIRKLKSELQYSEKRRLHAEEQEEMSSRERAQLRDENVELRAHNTELVQNNKALQEACSLLEEQLIDLEKISDLNEGKSKDHECEVEHLRCELSALQEKLGGALSLCAARAAEAAAATHDLERTRDQHSQAAAQVQLLQERIERADDRVATLEARCASLEGERATAQAALGSAARRVRDLQEECATLRTRAHDHHELALQLRAQLDEAQEQLESAREAAEAATAWWRTRETKADATLRQQAKLIDFLQAKVEEAGRKKCSIGNKLFGRSGRRTNASPPLRRANRELREEVDRLRAKLASSKSLNESNCPPTPRRNEKKTPNGTFKSIDTPDGRMDTRMNSSQESFLQIVWRDGSRERVTARCVTAHSCCAAATRSYTRAWPATTRLGCPSTRPAGLSRSITISNPDARGSTAVVVCGDRAARAHWLSALPAPAPAPALTAGYTPRVLYTGADKPLAAAVVADDAVAIGCNDGLRSLRSPVRLMVSESSPRAGAGAVSSVCVSGARALLAHGGTLLHAAAPALASALRRADHLQPALRVDRVPLPDAAHPHLITAMTGPGADGSCAVALGRRVVLLRWDAAAAAYTVSRAFGLERAPAALLLTRAALYVAAERPLRAALPQGALEPLAAADATVAAAARTRSAPRAVLLVCAEPAELLLCYAECGVFVDDRGRRTRPDDPKWSAAVREFAFVRPFLYAVGDDDVTIVHVGDDAYRAPACTCDSASVASSGSEFCAPETFSVRLPQPALLGTTTDGIIVRTKRDDGYQVSVVGGLAAFRSVGASLESLVTASESEKSSTPELARSLTDLGRESPQDTSLETLSGATGFLADIKKRARQLREKNRRQNQMDADEVIKEILTTEIGLKRGFNAGRKSPALTSEFDSDSESQSEDESEGSQRPEDLCAEMFTRQVRFQ
ncbi:LOW QUALITY PROTEIN: citron rho-interacting kinase [Leguminivora glycinivorella]|uniref:LOW QUALITY PROTEIN: citron rho-interacting kinase n=1 Tax=Leguminivora glycinivorella TaxID=1035111 RepID=UPI00200FBB86|nr:LOW QUALITY PROTEIN: citron rho-interacting kinase [Leguminivora glycinivorella]